MKKQIKKVLACVLTGIMLLSATPVVSSAADDVSAVDNDKAVVESTNSSAFKYSDYYATVKDIPNAKEDIVLDHKDLNENSTATVSSDELYGVKNSINLSGKSNKASFNVDIAETGKYNLLFDYAGIQGTSMNIQIEVYVDGKALFEEIKKIELYRWWKNSSDEWLIDRSGNQVTSEQVETFAFRKQYAYDYRGIEKDNFEIALTKGTHTIDIVAVQEPVAFKNVTLKTIEAVKSNKEVIAEYNGKSDYTGPDIVIQGENAFEKSDHSLISKSDTLSSAVNPSSYSKNVINYIGATNWSDYGQTIKWNVNIEKSGFYNVGFHYKQAEVLNASVYRTLKVDGVCPFEEASDIKFDYTTTWVYNTVKDAQGNACKLYLEEGPHTIELMVDLGPVSDHFKRLEEIVRVIGDDYLSIAMITGETPDVNRDYDLFDQIPNLEADFTWAVNELKSLSEAMSTQTKNSSQYISIIKGTTRILNQMLETKYLAHTYKKDLYSQYTNLSSILYELLKMPMSLDEIRLTSPDSGEPEYTNFLKQTKHVILQFLYTFTSDYAGTNKGNYDVTLKIWTTWGADQTQVLNSLISESFTPKYGIDVNVQITSASVIQGMLTNNAPDLSLGVARSSPVNFALRGAIYDLSKFDDFEEVLTRFNKGAESPYRYKDGCYAIPDTQSFWVMYYRTDIFESLGLEVPTTWDEFLEVSAVIQRNKMTVSMPTPDAMGILPTLLMQNGLSIYNEERNKAILDTDEAINVFTEWTEFYTKYKMPVTTDFYNRFRVGVTPLGISSYVTYNTLKDMAPEISGRWAIATVPGTVKDGELDYTTFGGGTGCIILNDSKYKDEAWTFLKWWTSTDTQYRYSKNLESLLGATGRVATSNKEAMQMYSWKAEDLEIIMKQWDSVEEIPEVPGSYYLTRSIEQAFYAVQNGKATPTDSIIKWNGIMNEEIERKIDEYK